MLRTAERSASGRAAAAVTARSCRSVLKIPVDQESGATETAMLNRWSASGATPGILHFDQDSGVFLMSRIVPGEIAWPVHGAGDSAQFGELLSRLNAPGLPEPPELKDLADIAWMRIGWARERFADKRYADAMERFGAATRLARAEKLLEVLLSTTTERHVLHANLQAKNILQGPGRWYTIDPLGAVGDINAEAGLWVALQDGPESIPERLSELCAHPMLDENRLYAWTYVLAVAEYRSYLPASGDRIVAFVQAVDPAELTNRVQPAR
ncbi:aminoglycoside phosphotransferase family protein [Nocardia grenadensis]|uniref:aminoglycoside phosphotransferase family protein n=1 Tax=Nocardia grenadensis TaxID=931537 RepID=UPI001471A6EA|nr:aminoglycoside phosphotransferase family protein [Nocardia grenadensis]